MLSRRPAPSILFTAVAATALLLPLAVDGLPGDRDDAPGIEAHKLAEQPLAGLGGGETIREIHQDTPFSLVALTSDDLTRSGSIVTSSATRRYRGRRILGATAL